VADFHAARSGAIPPLPWTNLHRRSQNSGEVCRIDPCGWACTLKELTLAVVTAAGHTVRPDVSGQFQQLDHLADSCAGIWFWQTLLCGIGKRSKPAQEGRAMF